MQMTKNDVNILISSL